jgi:ribosomal protein S20
MRKEVKAFLKLTDPEAVKEKMPKLYSIIDRLYRRGIYPRNKVARIKSRVARHANNVLAKSQMNS